MLLVILRVVYLLVCAGAILAYINPEDVDGDATTIPRIINDHKLVAFFALLFISQIVTIADMLVRKKRIEVISAIYFGILIGVLLAYLMIQALNPIVKPPYSGMAVMLTLLILPYICVSILLQTKDDFRFVIPYVEFARDLKGGRPLVVDSSSLIDGRIADVVETQILESQLIVPDFVLAEVQDIADSNDKNRRARGRRGLEVLATMQKSPHTEVRVQETSRTDFRSVAVDHKLVELAKQLRGGVITNDFNLNKVASVQGIPVINLNDVANALRPRFIPGERLKIKIIKEGEGPGQGVGYLDDGTMVVCEGAAGNIGREIDCIVSSVLQSSAGRMIFVKPVYTAGG
ncbi:MAG: PIN/TRAM domain-containing protein [Planctomycetaceae bacterium]